MPLNLASMVLMALAISCLIVSGYCFNQEIGEVNRKLPDDQQISYWGIHAEKLAKVHRLYRRLYPQGRIHLASLAFAISGFVFLLLSAVSDGFFRR
jgi:hypothetical protein